ncbi:MAG: aldo/keto reductase [Chloroflexi bacterium]|nr:aldo/keto reductase [Chloroflexota bacterium]
MRYETVHDVTLPKIGFGTWSIGGGTYADRSRDAKSLAALRSALDLGYTHFDTAEMYADGHAEELIGRAVRESGVKREALFVTSKVKPSNLHYSDVLKSCETSLRRLSMEYIDLYLIHWPMVGMNLSDTFRALNKLVHDGKVKHLGVSNFKLKLLKEAQELSETPIITNQVPYSLSDRSYVKNGVLEYCQKNNILLTAYSPVDVGRLNVGKALQSIAEAHNASPFQIALAWLINQPYVITIPMSFDPKHQKENLDAADTVLTDEEMKQLN